jgi:cytochrome c556
MLSIGCVFIVSKLTFALLTSCLTSGLATTSHAQDTPKQRPSKSEAESTPSPTRVVPHVSDAQPMSFWMQKKLDYSKAILESLTKGDFEQLAENAEQMRLLGKIEGFVRRKNDDYRMQMQTFDFANQELVRQAKRRNVEGAILAFNQLTTSCVACHVMLREGVE